MLLTSCHFTVVIILLLAMNIFTISSIAFGQTYLFAVSTEPAPAAYNIDLGEPVPVLNHAVYTEPAPASQLSTLQNRQTAVVLEKR